MQISDVANRSQFLKYKKLTNAYLFPRFGVKFLLGKKDEFKNNFGVWKLKVETVLAEHPEFKKLTGKLDQKNKTVLFVGGAFWKSMFLLNEGVPGSTVGIISEEQINFFNQLMNTDKFEELEKTLNPMLERLAGFKKVKIETFLIAFMVLKNLYQKLKPQKMIVTEEAVREGIVNEMING
jgi:exopolyphosphatase/pppGpp-phosphohydrolase